MSADASSSDKRTPPIVVWRQTPLDIEGPFYDKVFEKSEGCVAYMMPFAPERRRIQWPAVNAPQTVIGTGRNSWRRARKIVGEYPGAVHLFYGLRGGMMRYVAIARADANARVIIIAERPNDHGKTITGLIANFLSSCVYMYLAARTRSKIDGFLAMGERGVAEYSSLGFPRDKLFPFMYVAWSTPPAASPSSGGEELKCVYIGRMDAAIKGVDVLLRAIDMLPGEGFRFDFVGDYGGYLGEVQEAVSKDPRLRHLGSWHPKDVVARLAGYDCCLVPSRHEGWNVNVNHALNAGIPVIVTEDAISNDLVASSRAGRVIRSGDAGALARELLAMERDRSRLEGYRSAALEFRERISLNSASEYLWDVIRYVAADARGPRPIAPWGVRL